MGYQHIPKMIGTKKTTLQTTPSLFLVLINMKEKHIPSWVSYWERLSHLFRSQRIHGWPMFLCVRRTRYITIRDDTGMETWLRFTSWWFQPISKIWSSNWIISPTFGMKTKTNETNHPVYHWQIPWNHEIPSQKLWSNHRGFRVTLCKTTSPQPPVSEQSSS